MTKYCPKCGAPNDDNAQFCTRCGYSFIQTGQKPTQQPIPYVRKSKKWVIVGVIAVIIIIIIVMIGAAIQSSAINVTALNVTIQYNGATAGYLGPTQNSLKGFNTTAGSTFTYSITFYNSATLLTHSINSIQITT
ncbi:MAG: zinc ribbon domain-containing protein, partial [Thermoplasmata archaeon]